MTITVIVLRIWLISSEMMVKVVHLDVEVFNYFYDIRSPIENICIDPDTSIDNLEVCKGNCDNDSNVPGS